MSTPGNVPIEFVAGDRYVQNVEFFADVDGASAVDVSDRVFKAQVRRDSAPGALVIADFSINMTDAATGLVVIGLTGDQTRLVFDTATTPGWDFQQIITGETDPDTLFQGAVTRVGDFTR